ncbi:MAG: cation-efflux pump, partial [Terriglobia bacterium]
MVSSPAQQPSALSARQKQAVAWSSLLAAALLVLLKTTVGWLTGSLGILSEAAHSGLDLVAAFITLLSVRLADRPADSSHPFGHGKFEHLSVFAETTLLLVTCGWIVFEAVRRLSSPVHVRLSVWAFVVMGISIIVDALRSRSLSEAARRHNSQALEADALHFSTDIYGSSAVILGLLLILASQKWHIPWLRIGDPAAALAVAAITVYISARLGKRTVDALVDAAPSGIPLRIAGAIAGTPDVLNPERIRVRQSGSRLFVDLRLTLRSNIPLERAQAVEDQVESRVQELYPGADVVIHSAPQNPPAGDLVGKIRAVAHRSDFQIHDMTPYELPGGRVNLSLDLELDPELTLAAAHRKATELENEIKRQVPEVNEVNIHVEPMRNQVEPALEAGWLRGSVKNTLLLIARETPGIVDCHDLVAHQVGSNILVSLHCTLDADLPLGRVHDITEDLEL